MREITEAMQEAWEGEVKTGGTARPVIRATIQIVRMNYIDYDTALAPGGDFETDRHRTGHFASIPFGHNGLTLELRNILSFNWTRSVNQDIAEATMILLNSEVTPIGTTDDAGTQDDFDMPGWFSPSRGTAAVDTNPWGYSEDSAWNGVIVPDRMICTYEGYGRDDDVWPGQDTNLMQSGTWIIQDVDLNADGNIEVKMYDLAWFLKQRIVFPPVIPKSEYPLSFSKIRTENVPARDATGGSWTQLQRGMGTAISSNAEYIGEGLTNPPYPHYVSPSGGFNGHFPGHVIDDDSDTYWQSTGQTTYTSKVWWQINLNSGKAMNGIRLRTQNGPYRVYVSLHNGTKWLGQRKIPYSPTTEDVDLGADIPFVKSDIADKNALFDIILPRKYGNIRKIRITFTRLIDTGVGDYPFRAGLRLASIYTAGSAAALGFGSGTILKTVGNYRDWTDVVKWACAWGGFFWPPHDTGLDYVKLGHDVLVDVTYASPDPVLPKGRVWGDFMNTGTAGIADLTVDLFDKQPLLDICSYVRDMVGFCFFVDEQGAVVWRMPNIWTIGNYISPSDLAERTGDRTTDIIELNDDEALFAYNTSLTSKNIRERLFVADVTGKIGTVIKGYVPYRVNFGRIAGWTDQGFATKRECTVMADMIGARQMFDYRRGHATIPGNPAIQVDDQIRIFERVTNETYYHYVESISSRINMAQDDNTWTYDLETHWLGESPEDAWIVKVEELKGVTQSYLSLMGAV